MESRNINLGRTIIMALTKVINDLIDLNATDATKSLKMPKGAAYSGTADPGMIRNSSEAQSQGSTNVMQHFNGTDWKSYENLATPLVVDYLVIAGGGGGGSERGGGGGAGGYRNSFNSEPSGGGNTSETSLSLITATDYAVTVGPGGANNTSGSNSIFASIDSDGGAEGGSGTGSEGGGTGGAGGGGAALSGTLSGGAGTTHQGYDGGGSGGTTYPNGYYAGAGGGAGSAGTNGSGTTGGGDGGNGLSSSITGTPVLRAGGGGGGAAGSFNPQGAGAGGSGGGGAGGAGDTNQNGGVGTVNTGSGGGGGTGGGSGFGGTGGAGVVIIRYSDDFTISETTSGGNVLTFTTDSTTVANTKITIFTAGESGTIRFSL